MRWTQISAWSRIRWTEISNEMVTEWQTDRDFGPRQGFGLGLRQEKTVIWARAHKNFRAHRAHKNLYGLTGLISNMLNKL